MLDGRADHRGAGPRPRDPHGVSAIRGRQETGPAPVRLLRAHGHGRERLPSRARPRALPPRYLHGVQAGLPTRLRTVQESALRESRRQHYTPIAFAKRAHVRPQRHPERPETGCPANRPARGREGHDPRPDPRVFEALLDPGQLVQWWADEPRVEAELGGRYEGTLSDGRIEGSITAIDGPGKFSFMWPILQEGGSVETSVAYELAPKGPETFVHVVHRAPQPLAGSWTDFWNAALESLRAFLESSAPVSE